MTRAARPGRDPRCGYPPRAIASSARRVLVPVLAKIDFNGVSLSERFGRTDPPKVEESPAAEAVAEDERSHVHDVVRRQQLPPDRLCAGLPPVASSSRGTGALIEVHRFVSVAYLSQNQRRQLRHARDIGGRIAADLRLRVG